MKQFTPIYICEYPSHISFDLMESFNIYSKYFILFVSTIFQKVTYTSGSKVPNNFECNCSMQSSAANLTMYHLKLPASQLLSS